MKSKFGFLIAGVLSFNYPLFSQTVDNSTNLPLNAYDINGKPFTAKKADIAGSPLLNDTWGKGVVKFANGSLVRDAFLQFNLELNELYFQKNEQTYAFVEPIKEFVLTYEGNAGVKSAMFRNGYPTIGKNQGKTFYEVLADGGKVQFLKYTVKTVAEQYNYGGGNKKYYQSLDSWYLYDVEKAGLIKITKNKKSILEALPSYNERIDSFQKENNSKLRDEDDIAALVRYLNK